MSTNTSTPSPDSSKHRPAGESWVWFCSMTLATGILMIIGMLGLILWKGFAVFWPKEVMQFELKADYSQFQLNPESVTLAGSIAKTQERINHELTESGEKKENTTEYQLFVGNKDVYGFMYKYIDANAVASEHKPENILMAERVEYGHALMYPQEITLSDGTQLSHQDANFEETFTRLVHEAESRWAEIKYLEQKKIGAVNRKIKNLEQSIQQDTKKQNDTARETAELATLEAEYQKLFQESRLLRAKQEENILSYTLPSGESRKAPIGDILGFYYPNQLGFFDKCTHFVTGLWKFVSTDPREANTEGGIFPAIFGTFIMTVMMSAAVTPFGVLAAIYMHEYAKQGPFLRSVRIAINNLAGVPSIVFGVFGLGFFVYGIGGGIDSLFYSESESAVFGTGGILWASLTLALMTVPVVIVATEEALSAVTRGVRESSLALGASKWQTIQRIVLPASIPGILTGLILAMARGAGEVAPLMLVGVVKSANNLPFDLTAPFIHMERKFMHLGFHIYDLGFQSPDSEAAIPMVFATTFLLILLVLVLNLGAIIIRNRLRKKYATGTF